MPIWVKLFEETINPFPRGNYCAAALDVECKTYFVPSNPRSYIRQHIFDIFRRALEEASRKRPEWRRVIDGIVLCRVAVWGYCAPASYYYYVRYIVAVPRVEEGGVGLQGVVVILRYIAAILALVLATVIAAAVILYLVKVSPSLQQLLRELGKYAAYTAVAGAVAAACISLLPAIEERILGAVKGR